ncbi:MAG: DUF4349 domain-containing protein [Lewinellaceae bacterium]|nr:DUF4349 domain-containing protein [Lewinellaceae bacterium]
MIIQSLKSVSTIGLLLLLVGCGSTNNNLLSGSNNYLDEYQSLNSESSDYLNRNRQEDRMVAYTAYVKLTAENPDSVIQKIYVVAKNNQGYVVESNKHWVSIKIIKDNLLEALDEVAKLGKINDKNISGVDITNEYTDYNIRLENAESTRKKYLELLNIATNVESIINIERELERLNETIDLLKSKINKMNHSVEYSILSIEINKKVKPGILGYVTLGIYNSVKWLFVRN